MSINNVKTRIFKNNEKYFKFASKNNIKIYSVGFTKNRNIKVEYKDKVIRKKKEDRLKSSVVCV